MAQIYTNKEIVEGIIEGEARVIYYCFEKVLPKVKRYVKDEIRAEEIAWLGTVKLHEYLTKPMKQSIKSEKLDKVKYPLSYLATICYHIFLENVIFTNLRVYLDSEKDMYIHLSDDGDSPEVKMRKTAFDEALKEGLKEIGQRCYTILTLYSQDDLKLKQIAEFIGLGYKNTVYHFTECKRKLKNILLKYLPDLEIGDFR